jgi:hypothetical protein
MTETDSYRYPFGQDMSHVELPGCIATSLSLPHTLRAEGADMTPV